MKDFVIGASCLVAAMAVLGWGDNLAMRYGDGALPIQGQFALATYFVVMAAWITFVCWVSAKGFKYEHPGVCASVALSVLPFGVVLWLFYGLYYRFGIRGWKTTHSLEATAALDRRTVLDGIKDAGNYRPTDEGLVANDLDGVEQGDPALRVAAKVTDPMSDGADTASAERRSRRTALNPFLCKSEEMRRLSILLWLALVVAWFTWAWVEFDHFKQFKSQDWAILVGVPFGAYLPIMAIRLLGIWVVKGDVQRLVLVVVIAIFVTMFAYPPFHTVGDKGVVVNMGYAWLLKPPRYEDDVPATVNIAMLMTQWLGVLIVGGLAYALGKRNSS